LKPEEIAKLTAFLRAKFANPAIAVKKRPQKNDSGEVYIGEEFIGVIFRDEEDGELSYNFSMAILEFDLE
jgi:Holliday junction resolvase